ncbi:MAG: DinB family protein [Dehalococcoidia bacterium]|nr:DinB family protein [Dehalococcoidia bacterium]
MAETVRINFVTGAVRRYVPEIEALRAIPTRIDEAIAGQPMGWLRTADAEGEWAPARVVGHVIAYVEQSHENLYRMAAMTDPVLKLADDAGVAATAGWEHMPGGSLMERLEAAVARCVEVLAELPDASWGRPGLHPTGGRRSIVQQVRLVTAHCVEHAVQLEGMRR